MRARALAAAAAAVFALGCHGPSGDDGMEAPASPQASAMPAPLAASPTPTGSATAAPMREGGVVPTPIRGNEPLASDLLPRETVGYTLSAVFKPADVVGPPRAPQVNAAGIAAGREKTALRLAIDLAATRMRVALTGVGFVLPRGTEIRARADRFGHVVVWPGGATYRPLAPGSLRALFAERRFDVAPITRAEVRPRDEPGKRIGIRTRKVDVTTRAGHATFELGRLGDLDEGGVLLCRMLLDLMNAPPAAEVCGAGELPLRADFRWTGHGGLGFEVTGVLKKPELSTASLHVPPPRATFAPAPLPVSGVAAMLSPEELAAFRTEPADIPAGPFASAPGLVVMNGTDELRLLYIDGVAVAWAAPFARETVRGLRRGRYNAQWRTFLGDAIEPATVQSVPGLSQIGPGDAGAPP